MGSYTPLRSTSLTLENQSAERTLGSVEVEVQGSLREAVVRERALCVTDAFGGITFLFPTQMGGIRMEKRKIEKKSVWPSG